ncbi:epocide hydrolase domain-containing protein [Moesziomyces antarcticus]|uniref:Related to Epoxide hydrolase 1 n=1 Tax=Pseudozyma antarctica TaxID=84753 RepID=A0A5C3FIY6_PSEA2|nr:epocide hydrolase domain-containing protein [Moesziomyces antarcticus]GAK63711.1 epocide hydrolase domain-containing protein [Moesziomyces antarcticus]SPO44308.1 related to Epoxide hydrolase 1 [Moesziomyces antarcticus]
MSSAIPPITTPKPFEIVYTDDEVADLRSRLRNTRLPTAPYLPEDDRQPMKLTYKPDLPLVKQLVDKWAKFDFVKFQKHLNSFPHFTTSVDWCTQLHFVHKRSSRPDAIPIMLIHGWPGSWFEFAHVIDELVNPADKDAPAFHVVVPSLPGFMYSTAPPNKKLGEVRSYTRILDALMRGLGYDKYASQGGDWGSPHARALGVFHSHKDGTGCRAVHLNFCPVAAKGLSKFMLNSLPAKVTLGVAKLIYGQEYLVMAAKGMYFEQNRAYYDVQRTRPAQLLYGLVDSPVGLLGWLGNIYDTLSERAPDHPRLNMDACLEIATLFWFTSSIGTSFIPYTVNLFLPEIHGSAEYKLPVPLAYSDFPQELVNTPKFVVDATTTSGKTRWIAKSPIGGHFAAHEEPTIFVSHLRNAFSRGGKWKGHEEDGIQSAQIAGGLWDEVRDQEARASKI